MRWASLSRSINAAIHPKVNRGNSQLLVNKNSREYGHYRSSSDEWRQCITKKLTVVVLLVKAQSAIVLICMVYGILMGGKQVDELFRCIAKKQ